MNPTCMLVFSFSCLSVNLLQSNLLYVIISLMWLCQLGYVVLCYQINELIDWLCRPKSSLSWFPSPVPSWATSFSPLHQNPANSPSPDLSTQGVCQWLQFLNVLCNWSLQDGVLPLVQKRLILVPVLKHSGLDSSDPEANKLHPECQSGFQKGHSTETLLLCLL